MLRPCFSLVHLYQLLKVVYCMFRTCSPADFGLLKHIMQSVHGTLMFDVECYSHIAPRAWKTT